MRQRAMSGNVPPVIKLNSDAGNGHATWDYDAKTILVTCIDSTYNHVVLFNVGHTQPSDICYISRDGANSNDWYAHAVSGIGTVTATPRSLDYTPPAGFICTTVIPLQSEFPTNIPS